MITIGENPLKLEHIQKIVFEGEKINFCRQLMENVLDSFEFLKDFSQERVIYGINTGFGPMAQYKISDHDQKELQFNLIRSHASGSGNPIPSETILASMVARLNSLAQGYSGVHPQVIHLLGDLINRRILPVIYEHGGVGASGDLVQLAHIALGLVGEGEVIKDGQILPAKKVFQKENIQPIDMHLREGLALMNGTSVMTGIGLINLLRSRQLIDWSLTASVMLNEVVQSYDDHFSAELNQTKHHSGQRFIAEKMRNWVKGSQRIRKRSDNQYQPAVEKGVFVTKVQEYYSLRCIPQVLGPIWDTWEHAEKVLVSELNSVNDNPIIDRKSHHVFHGGNFHGDYVSLEMDKLKIAITRLSMLSERQLNFLLNDKLNELLPPFINLGKLGLNFGMQGMQFTATSTVAENQTLSFPMYVHSIPNNNDNQDIVSMGSNSALICRKVIENAFEVLAVEMIALLQAIDYLDIASLLSPHSQSIFRKLREIVPTFVADSIKYPDLRHIKNFMLETRFSDELSSQKTYHKSQQSGN